MDTRAESITESGFQIRLINQLSLKVVKSLQDHVEPLNAAALLD